MVGVDDALGPKRKQRCYLAVLAVYMYVISVSLLSQLRRTSNTQLHIKLVNDSCLRCINRVAAARNLTAREHCENGGTSKLLGDRFGTSPINHTYK